MLEQAGFQGIAAVVSSVGDVWLSQLTLDARFTLCTGYSRLPAFLLGLPLLPRRSSVCSGCAEGNGVVSPISLQLEQS